MSKTISGPPGVGIRECSPVRVAQKQGGGSTRAVVADLGEQPLEPFVCYKSYNSDTDEDAAHVGVELCALDLTDPTGFMHGVWAVAAKYGDSACMATISHRYGFWEVKTAVGVVRFGSHPGKASEIARHVVPELKGIPHDQPAQALAAIMRHVFEVTP